MAASFKTTAMLQAIAQQNGDVRLRAAAISYYCSTNRHAGNEQSMQLSIVTTDTQSGAHLSVSRRNVPSLRSRNLHDLRPRRSAAARAAAPLANSFMLPARFSSCSWDSWHKSGGRDSR